MSVSAASASTMSYMSSPSAAAAAAAAQAAHQQYMAAAAASAGLSANGLAGLPAAHHLSLAAAAAPLQTAATAAPPPPPPPAAAAAAATTATTLFNVGALLNQKDSRWLQLEVCREYQRHKCSRADNECKFAHPPDNIEVQSGRVTACYDSIKVGAEATQNYSPKNTCKLREGPKAKKNESTTSAKLS